jgi:serine/threonine protein kinase
MNGKPSLKQETLADSSKDLIRFLDRCLTNDPMIRADTSELLAHDFMKKATHVSILIPNIQRCLEERENEKETC